MPRQVLCISKAREVRQEEVGALCVLPRVQSALPVPIPLCLDTIMPTGLENRRRRALVCVVLWAQVQARLSYFANRFLKSLPAQLSRGSGPEVESLVGGRHSLGLGSSPSASEGLCLSLTEINYNKSAVHNI